MTKTIKGADINVDTIEKVLEQVPGWSLRKLARVTWEMTQQNQEKVEGRYRYSHEEQTARNRLIGGMFKAWVEGYDADEDLDPVEKLAVKVFKEAVTRFGIKRVSNPERLDGFLGWEFYVTTPEVTAERGYGKCWMIGHDAGPYNWGVSMGFKYSNPDAYCESYYGNDVLVVPA